MCYPADHSENEKINKYLDLAGELKNLWNNTITVILTVVGALGMASKGLEKGQEELRPYRPQHC